MKIMKIKNYWVRYTDLFYNLAALRSKIFNLIRILSIVYIIILFISPAQVFAKSKIYTKYINFHGILLPKTNITINGDNIPLRPLIIGLAHEFHINYALSNIIKGDITLHITKVPLNRALKIIFTAGNLSFSVTNGVLFIGTDLTLTNSYNTYKIRLKNIQAKTVLTVLTPILSKGAKAFAAPHGNSILVYDLPSNIKKIKDIVKGLDIKKKVVLLQARIVDVSNNFTRNLGISWSFSPYQNSTITSTSSNITGFSIPTPLSQNTLNINLGTSWQNFGLISAQLSMGQQLGWDKIISSPNVSVVSGQTATINSGITMYYTAYTAASSTGTTAPSSPTSGVTLITQQPVTSTLQSISLGLTLTVTPIVESKNSILLNVTVSNSQPNFGQLVDGFPTTNNKNVTTTVLVKNRSTLVIGGILSTDKSRSNNGIPFLSNLPVVGYLFSTRQRQVTKEQLMIFISPKIVN